MNSRITMKTYLNFCKQKTPSWPLKGAQKLLMTPDCIKLSLIETRGKESEFSKISP